MSESMGQTRPTAPREHSVQRTSAYVLSTSTRALCFAFLILAISFGAGCDDQDGNGSVERDGGELDGATCGVACTDNDAQAGSDAALDARADLEASSPGDATHGEPASDAGDASNGLLACGQAAAQPGTILATGHQAPVVLAYSRGERILSQDATSHWVLWEAQTGRQIADGLGSVYARRDLFIVDARELRSLTDGALVRTVPVGARLSEDATYLWKSDGLGLAIWSLTGEPIAAKNGTYPHFGDQVVATAQGLGVANGPAGASVIETLRMDGSSATSAPFSGTFIAWFADGERFLTRASGDLLRVYSASVQQEAAFLPPAPSTEYTPANVGGYGDFYWHLSQSGNLALFKVGSSEPISVANGAGGKVTFSGGVLELRTSSNAIVADLRAERPTFRPQPPAVTVLGTPADVPGLAAGAGASDSLVYGTAHVDGLGRLLPFGCGTVIDIAGSLSGRTAVASSDGKIRIYDLPSTSPWHVIDFQVEAPSEWWSPDAQQRGVALDLTQDGQWLVARNLRHIIVYALKGGTATEWWRSTALTDTGDAGFFSLARTAGRLLVQRCSSSMAPTSCTRSTIDLATRQSLPTYTSSALILASDSLLSISPRGEHAALTKLDLSASQSTVTYLFDGATINNTLDLAILSGWVSESQVVVHRYRKQGLSWRLGYVDTAIVELTGTPVATFSLGQAGLTVNDRAQGYPCRIREVDESRFYCPRSGKIHGSQDGSVLWSGAGIGGDISGELAVQITPEARVIYTTWR